MKGPVSADTTGQSAIFGHLRSTKSKPVAFQPATSTNTRPTTTIPTWILENGTATEEATNNATILAAFQPNPLRLSQAFYDAHASGIIPPSDYNSLAALQLCASGHVGSDIHPGYVVSRPHPLVLQLDILKPDPYSQTSKVEEPAPHFQTFMSIWR